MWFSYKSKNGYRLKPEGYQIGNWVLKPVVSHLITEKLTKTPCGTAEC